MGTAKSAVEFSPPASAEATSEERTWGLPHCLMTELHHVSPAQLLLAAPLLALEEGGAEGKGGAGIKGPWITGCYGHQT